MNYLNVNQKLWDEKTEFHYKSEFYNVNDFLKTQNSLKQIELDLLGDIKGKKVLHLQCHFGMDTLSLSHRGAIVTGVDLSGKAIQKAEELKSILKLDTRFIQSDIYCLPKLLNEEFDIIYTSYGVIEWLPDTNKWANIISHFLKPEGKFVFVEFHPVVWMFSNNFKTIDFNYMDSDPIIEEIEGTYADTSAKLKNKSVTWNHGLANVMNPLIKNNIVITDFQEYNYSPYNCFENTIETSKDKYQIKELENKLPLVYSIVGIKKQ